MEYDWAGVLAGGIEYCCEGCARGEECTCSQHRHQYDSAPPLNRAAAGQLGIPSAPPDES
jgi:hypothetical protein